MTREQRMMAAQAEVESRGEQGRAEAEARPWAGGERILAKFEH